MLSNTDEAVLLADEIVSLKQTFKQSLIHHYSPEVVNKLVDNLNLAEATRLSILPEKLSAQQPASVKLAALVTSPVVALVMLPVVM